LEEMMTIFWNSLLRRLLLLFVPFSLISSSEWSFQWNNEVGGEALLIVDEQGFSFVFDHKSVSRTIRRSIIFNKASYDATTWILM
jgi:hypothetical protein